MCLFGTLMVVKQTNTIKIRVYLPELRFYNASKMFSREYYADLFDLGFYNEEKYVDVTKPLPNITFITALSYNHVGEAMALIFQFSRYFKGQKLLIYDIGLKRLQRKWIQENYCNVIIRDVNFTSLKIGSSLKTYRWKPIIIATALKEFPVVYYIDSSTDMKTNVSMNEFLSQISMKIDEPNIYAVCITDHSPYVATNPGMYDYFPPQFDVKSPFMLEAGKVIYIRSKSTYELALKWYVLCALEEECMAPKDHCLKCNFSDRHVNYANCHRYDQSALNLIMGMYPNFNQSILGMKYFWTHYGQVIPRTITVEC